MSRNLEVLLTMLAAAVGLVVPLILVFSGAGDLAAGAPVGLSKAGAAALVAAGAVLVVVRVVDEGGPEGLARDRDATVVSGTVGRADGGLMREPIGATECEAYLYLVEYQPRDGGGPLGDYEPLVSGLVAAGPLAVDADDGTVRLRPGRTSRPGRSRPTTSTRTWSGTRSRFSGASASGRPRSSSATPFSPARRTGSGSPSNRWRRTTR